MRVSSSVRCRSRKAIPCSAWWKGTRASCNLSPGLKEGRRPPFGWMREEELFNSLVAEVREKYAAQVRIFEPELSAMELPGDDWRQLAARDSAYNLGTAHARKGRTAEAVEAFRAAIRIDSTFLASYHELALAHAAEGDLAAAYAEMENAVRVGEGSAYTHRLLAFFHSNQGRYEEAEKALWQAIEVDSSGAEARYELGVLYNRQGRPGEAESSLMGALRLNPAYKEAWNELGGLYTNAGRHDEADRALKRAVAIDSGLCAGLLQPVPTALCAGQGRGGNGHAGAFREPVRQPGKVSTEDRAMRVPIFLTVLLAAFVLSDCGGRKLVDSGGGGDDEILFLNETPGNVYRIAVVGTTADFTLRASSRKGRKGSGGRGPSRLQRQYREDRGRGRRGAENAVRGQAGGDGPHFLRGGHHHRRGAGCGSGFHRGGVLTKGGSGSAPACAIPGESGRRFILSDFARRH